MKNNKKIIGILLLVVIVVLTGLLLFIRHADYNLQQEVNNAEDDKKPVGRRTDIQVSEINGYRYFRYGDTTVKEKERGAWIESEDYEIFIYTENDITFNSWDTVVDDVKSSIAEYCLDDLGDISNKEVIVNDLGTEVCVITGEQWVEGGTRSYVLVCHVTENGSLRYCYSGYNGKVDNMNDYLKDAIDLLKYNLETVIETEG